jgi:molybdopterin synthase catalytic subunit
MTQEIFPNISRVHRMGQTLFPAATLIAIALLNLDEKALFLLCGACMEKVKNQAVIL